MTTKYKYLKSNIPNLTKDAIYREQSTNPNPFNASVINDLGELQYVDRVYLEEVEYEKAKTTN